MIIGHFDLDHKTGIYAGNIPFLFGTLLVEMSPNPHAGEPDMPAGAGPRQPDYILQVVSGSCEIGGAWKGSGDEDDRSLSVELDSPMLPAPLHCVMFYAIDDKYHQLAWSRDWGKSD